MKNSRQLGCTNVPVLWLPGGHGRQFQLPLSAPAKSHWAPTLGQVILPALRNTRSDAESIAPWVAVTEGISGGEIL